MTVIQVQTWQLPQEWGWPQCLPTRWWTGPAWATPSPPPCTPRSRESPQYRDIKRIFHQGDPACGGASSAVITGLSTNTTIDIYHVPPCTTYVVYITHHLTSQLVNKTNSTLAKIFLSFQTANCSTRSELAGHFSLTANSARQCLSLRWCLDTSEISCNCFSIHTRQDIYFLEIISNLNNSP